MYQYNQFLQTILNWGRRTGDRTKTGTISCFVPPQMRFNLQQGFPLVTTKKVHWKSVAHELIWFLRGETNIKYLKDNGVSIWDEWADENGELGPVYGRQWRAWPGKASLSGVNDTYWVEHEMIDQIAKVIQQIKDVRDNPESRHGRRLIVSAWNPAEVDEMKLPPCHMIFQFYVRQLTYNERLDIYILRNNPDYDTLRVSQATMTAVLDKADIPKASLSCHLYQRSADAFLGVPFNIASYALLTHIIARLTNLVPYEYVHTCGDAHIYVNHMDQVQEQLSRRPYPLPELVFSGREFTIDDIRFDDFSLEGYQSHPAIKAPVAV